MGISPSLVVVPNSTITNWVREFARWAPQLRVVPFYGEQNSRAIIKKYELFHDHVAQGTTGAKFHVLITTFDTAIAQKEISAVFKRVARWEVLVVDEGQRCMSFFSPTADSRLICDKVKGDSSLLFKRLTEMNTRHRVLMTGVRNPYIMKCSLILTAIFRRHLTTIYGNSSILCISLIHRCGMIWTSYQSVLKSWTTKE